MPNCTEATIAAAQNSEQRIAVQGTPVQLLFALTKNAEVAARVFDILKHSYLQRVEKASR